MRRAHGDVLAVQSKTILKGGLHLAVMANVIGSNPVRDVSPMRSKSRPKGATALTADELRGLLGQLRASETRQADHTRPQSEGAHQTCRPYASSSDKDVQPAAPRRQQDGLLLDAGLIASSVATRRK
jgi:hypothetical protein